MAFFAASTLVLICRVAARAVAPESPIRKHASWEQAAVHGDDEVSDGLIDSTLKQFSSHTSSVGIDAKGIIETGAELLDKASGMDKSSPVIRKHAFSGPLATSGDVEISTLQQTSRVVRSVGVDANGNIETNADIIETTSAVDKSSPIRKQALFMHDATTGEMDVPDVSSDSRLNHSQRLESGVAVLAKGNGDTGTGTDYNTITLSTRMEINAAASIAEKGGEKGIQLAVTTSQDATRSNSISSLVAERMTSSEINALLRTVAMVLQSRIGNFRHAGYSGKVGLAMVLFLGIVTGSLMAAVVARDGLNNGVTRVINSMSAFRGAPRAPNDSDGESDSSSDNLDPTDMPVQDNIRTGLVWKLERRYIDDLRSHEGSTFEPADRFAHLESWDLRFFSLDVDEPVVKVHYVSQLNDFNTSSFEIKLIETKIMEIPICNTGRGRRRKSNSGVALIGFYKRYLATLREIGYDLPESSAHDPANLFVLTISGTRSRGNCSLALGRHNSTIRVGDPAKQASPEEAGESDLDHMCLGFADRHSCKRWRNDITKLLEKFQHAEKKRTSKRPSELSLRLAQRAEAMERASSFTLDAKEMTLTNEYIG